MAVLISGCQQTNNDNQPIEKQIIKVGYFPNVTHAQALIGIGNGYFQETMGDNIEIKTTVFNAGPSEIEALFAGEIDIGYIGPSPAVNGFIKSNGESLRVISGAVSGGASLVVQPELYDAFQQEGIKALENKIIASPQQGNTQDISLRHYIKENNLESKTTIMPTKNADQLILFTKKEIDGAWSPEPWASRLIQEVSAKRLIDERTLWENNQLCITHVIANTDFINEHPELVKKWLQAHIDITEWINDNPDEAKSIANSEIEKLTTQKLPDEVLNIAWKMFDISVNPVKNSVYTFGQWAYEQGFLGDTEPDLTNLYDLKYLNETANTEY